MKHTDETDYTYQTLPGGWSPLKLYNSISGEYQKMQYPCELLVNGKQVVIKNYSHHHNLISQLFVRPLMNS